MIKYDSAKVDAPSNKSKRFFLHPQQLIDEFFLMINDYLFLTDIFSVINYKIQLKIFGIKKNFLIIIINLVNLNKNLFIF